MKAVAMREPLWREIREMGYTASVTTVSRFIGQLRKDSGTAGSGYRRPRLAPSMRGQENKSVP
jgi:hypothetical protein